MITLDELPATLLAARPTGFEPFQYALPVLLGYVLYVGIAGRFRPARPRSEEERPAWFLGLWNALSVALVLGVALHVAYRLPLDEARALLRPAAWTLGAALLPGYAIWFAWRASVRKRLSRDAALRIEETLGLDAHDTIELAGPVDAQVRYVPIPAARADEAARRELDEERRLREETEKHLQVTRKALYSLDAAARDGEDARADALIALEAEVEGHVRRSSSAEARATREECGRMQAESAASAAKREVLRLSSELRRGTEARARAVATAGKSVAFARRTLQARAQLEDRVRELEATLDNRQQTISSLIRALEKEKARTQEKVTSLAKQLVLHERQLRERRSLEEVARSVEGKLSTRLVKRVARARPVTGV